MLSMQSPFYFIPVINIVLRRYEFEAVLQNGMTILSSCSLSFFLFYLFVHFLHIIIYQFLQQNYINRQITHNLQNTPWVNRHLSFPPENAMRRRNHRRINSCYKTFGISINAQYLGPVI